jgi:DNA-binding NarL/FixJ family response regulator
MSIKIVIADDHLLVRDGIRYALRKRQSYRLVGEAQNGYEAIKVISEWSPDIALMDMFMPHMNGIEACGKLKEAGCKAKIIGLSCCADRRLISRFIAAGASAYVSKAWPKFELYRAIDAVYANRPFHFPAAVGIPEVCDQPHIPNGGTLSVREMQTLNLVVTGKSSRDISEILNVCLKTVEAHRHMVRRKTGLSSVAELTRYAIEQGIIKVNCERTQRR